jgi:tetratricopeptide (TPR) repeat protein
VRVDGVSQEAAILRQALSALRKERDPRRALALLDDYDRRFGTGALAWEATSARAQALLALGERTHALALLDKLPLRQDGQTGGLWVTRGELRSLAGRCAEALRDFEAILGAQSDRDQTARALYGRASCRARLGDLAGAEQDRQRYLRDFPQGPAAKQLMSSP